MRIPRNQQENTAPRLTLPSLVLAAVASLSLALLLSACQNVAGSTSSSMVRVIDASSVAAAANVAVKGTLVAANLGEGDISSYVSMTPSPNATVAITTTSGGTSLVSSTYTFLGGDQYSIFFTDNGSASSTTYTLAVLKDQSTSAPSGHSEFRFLNQAHSTGAVDIYMVPSTSTLVDSTPLITNLKVGNAVSYVSFLSQSVTMVIAATGTVFTTTNLTTAAYSSTSLTLSGGEVRTVLIVDNPLTSNPPVDVTIADDVN